MKQARVRVLVEELVDGRSQSQSIVWSGLLNGRPKRSENENRSMESNAHEEGWAFAAGAEAHLTGNLAVCAAAVAR